MRTQYNTPLSLQPPTNAVPCLPAYPTSRLLRLSGTISLLMLLDHIREQCRGSHRTSFAAANGGDHPLYLAVRLVCWGKIWLCSVGRNKGFHPACVWPCLSFLYPSSFFDWASNTLFGLIFQRVLLLGLIFSCWNPKTTSLHSSPDGIEGKNKADLLHSTGTQHTILVIRNACPIESLQQPP